MHVQMKKVFICIIMMLCLGVNNSSSQTIERKGNVFVSKSSNTRSKADTLVTNFKFKYKGVQYPIIINKGSGACYVWRKSGKTGKSYRQYMKPEITQAVCKELNIKYTPRNKK